MKAKSIVVLIALAMAMVACNLPSRVAKEVAVAPTPTPYTAMELYQGIGMEIYLPSSYVARDIADDLPAILAMLRGAISNTDTLNALIENLEGNVAWWGYDSAMPAVSPTRLLIIKNQQMASVPLNLLRLGIKSMMGGNSSSVTTDDIDLGPRTVTRISYAEDGDAWSAYVFKEQGLLWLVLFVTTPANQAAQTADFEYSISTMTTYPQP